MKPILFNTAMVRAILDGRKTVTRRLVKPRYHQGEYGWRADIRKSDGQIVAFEYTDEYECGVARYINPPYYPDNTLYVRETWADGYGGYIYKADDRLDWDVIKWNPSIHMPKDAARIYLRVTSVRAEHLHDMTYKDVDKEGIVIPVDEHGLGTRGAIGLFAELWDSTVQKPDLHLYGWTANPFVWVIEFERCDKPREDWLC